MVKAAMAAVMAGGATYCGPAPAEAAGAVRAGCRVLARRRALRKGAIAQDVAITHDTCDLEAQRRRHSHPVPSRTRDEIRIRICAEQVRRRSSRWAGAARMPSHSAGVTFACRDACIAFEVGRPTLTAHQLHSTVHALSCGERPLNHDQHRDVCTIQRRLDENVGAKESRESNAVPPGVGSACTKQ
ncbi:hypothetical protein B0H12DRAFT_1152303 [Mycena haematopus]|nr:hypothetical protein B0H12DRAFT_1152303 [Mycena haematopus]